MQTQIQLEGLKEVLELEVNTQISLLSTILISIEKFKTQERQHREALEHAESQLAKIEQRLKASK